MSNRFAPISMESLTNWIFTEFKAKGSIFGIDKGLFFEPSRHDNFKVKVYDAELETPFGVAAGPHTQMAQNIIVSWLCGARFIELKTIQTLDELEVPKPCIDVLDAGYNVEWSQELKIKQSFDEYVRAWVLIHALHKMFGFPGKTPGLVFNASIGYNFEGIQKNNVQWFLKKILNAGSLKTDYIEIVARYFPEVKKLDIPTQLTNNITLSTMHGCPPDEIGKIASYLINEWNFNTNVKLNPTLLGAKELREILNKTLGYREITVPDIAFEHDLKYPDAIKLLKNLQAEADKKDVTFGVKLTNTLEVENHRNVFDSKEKMMYMSGRPLHAISINVAKKLSNEFNGQLLMSYAGGADCFNAAELLSCGMKTITVCTDILRPGGYTRMLQYIENTKMAMNNLGASSITDFILKTAKGEKVVAAKKTQVEKIKSAAVCNLNKYADYVLSDPLLMRDTFKRANTKTARNLELFDCIRAPCTDECPVNQQAAQYIECVKDDELKRATSLIKLDNPLPTILGRACNHQCESVCTRTHYDEPIAIREIKRYITDKKIAIKHDIEKGKKAKIAVIGAGPCGLAAGYFLAQKGFTVTLFEEKEAPAGMVYQTIPKYRATQKTIDQDVEVIKKLGVDIKCVQKAGKDFTIQSLKKDGYKYIVIASGAQRGLDLGIPGENSFGVIDGLRFLRASKRGEKINLGAAVGVIGAGDVAMDCARTANRLTGGKVSVIYRRTIEEMPAHKEELDAMLAEGIEIIELTAPKEVVTEKGIIKALKCSRMVLSERDESGRKKPLEIPNSEFEIQLDNLIIAIGQKPIFDFFGNEKIILNKKGYIEIDSKTMLTSVKGIFAGGDAVGNGPATIVKACGDGKKIAASIVGSETQSALTIKEPDDINCSYKTLMKKRAKREFRVEIPELGINQRNSFTEIISTLSDTAVKTEVNRCLQCHKLCGTCVTVCPNKAIFTYRIKPEKLVLPVLKFSEGKLRNAGIEEFELKQSYQVAVFTPFCNECATCATFCPTAGKPYQDKPRFYAKKKEFASEKNNAFMFGENMGTIEAKFDGGDHKLSINKNSIEYSNNYFSLEMNNKFKIKKLVQNQNKYNDKTHSLKNFAIIYFLMKGIKKSMPEFLEGLQNFV